MSFSFSKIMTRRIVILAIPSVLLLLTALSLISSDYSPTRLTHALANYGNGLPGSNGHARVHSGFDRPGFELPIARGIPLRILPLGASTTKGQLSSDDNGYRRLLREKLVALGNPVNFVGTERDGNMTDNDHEAQNGARLDIMYHRIKANQIVEHTKPNIILIGLGTNDVMQDYELGSLYKRYYYFVEYLLSTSPQATIVMATLPVVSEHKVWNFPGTRVPIANAQIRKLAKILQDEGKPVVLAELNGPLSYQPESLQYDGSHPNDAGYALMGSIIFNAIVEADARGFLQAPIPIEGILDDGDAEKMAKDPELSEKMRIEKEKQEERESAAKQEIEDMKQELESFQAGVKSGEIVPIPQDPPKDPPGIGSG